MHLKASVLCEDVRHLFVNRSVVGAVGVVIEHAVEAEDPIRKYRPIDMPKLSHASCLSNKG